MALPAQISTAATWPDHEAGFVGPQSYRGPSLDVTLTSGDLNVGTNAAQRRARSFYFEGTLATLEMTVFKVGTLADGLLVEIQIESGGLPSDTAVATSDTLAAASVPSASNVWATFAFAAALALTADTRYWPVLRRSGSLNDTKHGHNVPAGIPAARFVVRVKADDVAAEVQGNVEHHHHSHI